MDTTRSIAGSQSPMPEHISGAGAFDGPARVAAEGRSSRLGTRSDVPEKRPAHQRSGTVGALGMVVPRAGTVLGDYRGTHAKRRRRWLIKMPPSRSHVLRRLSDSTAPTSKATSPPRLRASWPALASPRQRCRASVAAPSRATVLRALAWRRSSRAPSPPRESWLDPRPPP